VRSITKEQIYPGKRDGLRSAVRFSRSAPEKTNANNR